MQPDPMRAPRVVFEDPDLPHQIVIRLTGGNSHRIGISCNCLKGEPIEIRTRWEAAEAIAVWRAHAGQAEGAVPQP